MPPMVDGTVPSGPAKPPPTPPAGVLLKEGAATGWLAVIRLVPKVILGVPVSTEPMAVPAGKPVLTVTTGAKAADPVTV